MRLGRPLFVSLKMRGSKRDLLDMKLISSPLPPPPSLSTPTFSNALTGGISWVTQINGVVALSTWAGIAMNADGTVSCASSVLVFLSKASCVLFPPLSLSSLSFPLSLSRIQTHSLRFCNNSSLRLLSSVETSTRPPLSPATATTTGPPPAPQWATGETSA